MSLMTVSDDAWTRHRREPARAAGLVPLDARLEGAVDRRREVPVHALGRRSPRRRGRLRRAAREGSRQLSRGTSAPRARAGRACAHGPRAVGRRDEIAAACATAIAVPDGLDHQVRDHARERYGVMVSAGQGAGNIMRIGTWDRRRGRCTRSWASGRSVGPWPTSGSVGPVGAGLEAALAALSARRRPARVTLAPFELHRPPRSRRRPRCSTSTVTMPWSTPAAPSCS